MKKPKTKTPKNKKLTIFFFFLINTLYFLDEEDMLGVSDERKKDSADYKERLTTMINTQKMFSSLWETVRNQRANIKEWNETPLHLMSGEKVTNDAGTE